MDPKEFFVLLMLGLFLAIALVINYLGSRK